MFLQLQPPQQYLGQAVLASKGVTGTYSATYGRGMGHAKRHRVPEAPRAATVDGPALGPEPRMLMS